MAGRVTGVAAVVAGRVTGVSTHSDAHVIPVGMEMAALASADSQLFSAVYMAAEDAFCHLLSEYMLRASILDIMSVGIS